MGCVLTYGDPVGPPQGTTYRFRYQFPEAMTLDFGGREFTVVYQTGAARGEPKGVITAFESGVIG